MPVGITETGAIANKHAQAYMVIGYEISVRTNRNPDKGKRFAEPTGAKFVGISTQFTGDKRTAWDVQTDVGEAAPFDRRFRSNGHFHANIRAPVFDFGNAGKTGRPPLRSTVDGHSVLQVVTGIYTSCREGRRAYARSILRVTRQDEVCYPRTRSIAWD